MKDIRRTLDKGEASKSKDVDCSVFEFTDDDCSGGAANNIATTATEEAPPAAHPGPPALQEVSTTAHPAPLAGSSTIPPANEAVPPANEAVRPCDEASNQTENEKAGTKSKDLSAPLKQFKECVEWANQHTPESSHPK